jgi:hypothetical protein
MDMQIRAEYLPGKDNVIADRLSRTDPRGEYALKQEVLEKLLAQWKVQIDIDLFAEGWNKKHPQYCSWKKDRNALKRDAFSIPWNQFRLPLIHPPINLLPKIWRR